MKQKFFAVLLKIYLGILTRLMLSSMVEKYSHGSTSSNNQGGFLSSVFRSFARQKTRLRKGLIHVHVALLKRLIRRSPLMRWFITQGAICREEELKEIGRFRINPPPNDGRCEVCGKHISELEPFRDPDDPLTDIFGRELLVKTWRPEGPYHPEAEKAMKEAKKELPEDEDPLPWFISKYGEEKGNSLYGSALLYNSAGPSWECKDCARLGTDEYFEAIDKRSEENNNKQTAGIAALPR